MYRIAPLLIAFAFAHAAFAETTVRVPDDHETIQAAIDAAPDGAIIEVAEGEYHEALTLSRPLTLIGDGEVIVRSIDRQRPVFSLFNATDTTVRGITFESISPRPTGNTEEATEATVVVVSGTPVFEECIIRNGAHSGLKVGGVGEPVFIDCEFDGHGQSGAFVFGPDARARFTGCRFVNNRHNGIVFAGGAGGALEDCEVESNARNGIALVGAGTAPTITGVLSRYNAFNGIVVMEGAGGVLEDSEFHGNGASGINLQQVANDLVVRGNQAEENTYSGFHLAQPTAATITKNRFIRNGVISSGEISLLVRDEDFEALDLLEERLRVDQSRFPSGAWQLGFFYNFVLEGWHGTPQRHTMLFMEWCGRWQYARPDSAAARIARAKWHAQQAWVARGAGDPDTVPMAAWEAFAEQLAQAHAALQEARELTPDHPQVFTELVYVLGTLETIPEIAADARDAGWADADAVPVSAREVLEEGIAAEPAYIPLYTTYARFLLPRQGGEPGAVEAFAAEQADATAELLGDSLYAIIANDILHTYHLWTQVKDYFENFSFTWPRVVQGHRELIAHTPASTFWMQSLALHASLQGDKAIASEIFEELDDASAQWDHEVWRDEERYFTYYSWAVHDEPYPEVSTDLLLAIQMGDAGAARALLEEGIVVNAIGQLGYSPLTYAVDRRDPAMTALLLEHGADPDFQLYKGLASIHRAAGRNDTAILESLLDHGALPDALTAEGSNALMYAAFSGQVEAIEILLRRGAEIDLRHPTGSTAFIVAVREGQLDAARALLEAGADPSVTTNEGESALDIARSQGHEAIAAWLEEVLEPGEEIAP